MEYTIHTSTVFIKGNGIVRQYKVNNNEVLIVVDVDGDDCFEHFHNLGELPLNSEAKLLNELREKAKYNGLRQITQY